MFSRRAVVVVAVLFCLVSSLLPQTNADWDWMSKRFGQALNELFPIEQRSGMYVAYRSHRDLYTDVPEYSFIIGYLPSETSSGLQSYLTSHVRGADSTSAYDQMMALHRNHPNQPVAEIQAKVRLKRSNLTEMDCPAVKVQFLKFQGLRFSPPKFDEIVLHPLIHEFHVQAGTGDMTIVLSDEDNPLVKWAIETRRALESCANDAH